MIGDFRQAVGFLTRLPTGRGFLHDPGRAGRAVNWYGVTGLLIGLCAVLAAYLLHLAGVPYVICAPLALAVWVGATGALHLDGLADCGDAVMGAATRERMLEIMRDMQCGTGGICAVVIVLSVKLVAMVWLLSVGNLLAPLFAAVLARIALTVVIIRWPYVRESGVGSPLVGTCRPREATGINCAVILALLAISPQALAVSAIGAALGVLLVWAIVARRAGGCTGDVYGALVETVEAAVLVALSTL